MDDTESYNRAIVTFRDLLDGCEISLSNEFVRGGVSLMADLFGVFERSTSDRMDDILADLNRIPMFARPDKLDYYGVKPYVSHASPHS